MFLMKSGFVSDEEIKQRESKLREALKDDRQFQVKEGTSVEVAQVRSVGDTTHSSLNYWWHIRTIYFKVLYVHTWNFSYIFPLLCDCSIIHHLHFHFNGVMRSVWKLKVKRNNSFYQKIYNLVVYQLYTMSPVKKLKSAGWISPQSFYVISYSIWI